MPRPVTAPILDPIELSDDERRALEAWTRRPKTAQSLALRARTVLMCADTGKSNSEIARQLRVFRSTVGKWRARFLKVRLDERPA